MKFRKINIKRKSKTKLIFKLIRENKYYRYETKASYLAVFEIVIKHYPYGPFTPAHYSIYLSKFRLQMGYGLPTDHHHKIPITAKK